MWENTQKGAKYEGRPKDQAIKPWVLGPKILGGSSFFLSVFEMFLNYVKRVKIFFVYSLAQ